MDEPGELPAAISQMTEEIIVVADLGMSGPATYSEFVGE